MGSSSHISWKADDPERTLRDALKSLGHRVQELKSQAWESGTATIGGIRDIDLCNLAPKQNGWSFLMLHLNSQLGEPLAMELSKVSLAPVIVFHEYDQDAWGFVIFESGKRIGRFWNRPEVVDEEAQSCTVGPERVAKGFGVAVETVSPYLIHLDADSDDESRAFDGDEHGLGNHWVRCDFMKRLGLSYVSPGEPGSRHVYIKEPDVN
jgi:hypothetical protein